MRTLPVVALGGVLVLGLGLRLARQSGGARSQAAAPNVAPTATEGEYEVAPLRAAAQTLAPEGAGAREEVQAAADLVELGRPRLAVRVVDAADGAPIAGARVDLSTRADEREIQRVLAAGDVSRPVELYLQTATTDAAGVALLARIDGLDWELQASHPLYASSELLPFRLAPGEKTGAAPAFELVLSRASMTVTVLDRVGAPSPGTSVLVVELSGARREFERRTGSDGTAVFERLRPGRHHVEVLNMQRRGFVATISTSGSPSASSLQIDLGAGDEAQVRLVRPPRGRLYGCIREAGAPLVGARVSLAAGELVGGFGSTDSARTDAEGRYAGGLVEAGTYVVTISHATRCMDEEVEVELGEGDQVLDLDLSLALIEGRVLDSSGAPLPGATVAAERDLGTRPREVRAQRTIRTELDGTYRLRGVQAGVEIHVVASHAEHRMTRSAPLRLARNEVHSVDLRLLPALPAREPDR